MATPRPPRAVTSSAVSSMVPGAPSRGDHPPRVNGSMMTWAIYRQGTAARWMLADLDAVLAPYTKR
jgi:hypothetical protein